MIRDRKISNSNKKPIKKYIYNIADEKIRQFIKYKYKYNTGVIMANIDRFYLRKQFNNIHERNNSTVANNEESLQDTHRNKHSLPFQHEH